MILAHCIVAFVFSLAGLLCFGAGCMALKLRGRYWGMIWFMSCTGVASSVMMVFLKVQDILNGRTGGNTAFWIMHDMIQGAFVMVCAMTAIIYLIHWRPPSERH